MTAEQLVSWYRSKAGTGATPSVPVEELARLYIEEGRVEGVAGDLAFVQAMIETGWLRFSARVPGAFNNFAGLMAYDGQTGAASFPTAQLGVRAHIQFLRAYGDAQVTADTLADPPVSPRWTVVLPAVRGIAPSWADFGNGVWASAPAYATLIDAMYRGLAAQAGVSVK